MHQLTGQLQTVLGIVKLRTLNTHRSSSASSAFPKFCFFLKIAVFGPRADGVPAAAARVRCDSSSSDRRTRVPPQPKKHRAQQLWTSSSAFFYRDELIPFRDSSMCR
jgi:hypothetical protein